MKLLDITHLVPLIAPLVSIHLYHERRRHDLTLCLKHMSKLKHTSLEYSIANWESHLHCHACNILFLDFWVWSPGLSSTNSDYFSYLMFRHCRQEWEDILISCV